VTRAPPVLPPSVHVFVRDWLSSNNVVLKSTQGGGGHVVVDSGYHLHAALTLQLLASPWGLAGAGLAQLVNTHCHSDHIGGNAAIRERYGCSIAIPAGEAGVVDPSGPGDPWLSYPDQYAPPFVHDAAIHDGEAHRWGDLEWQALAAPGNDMGALVFHNAEHRLLITGDALWENGFGFVLPAEIDPQCLPATRVTLDRIASLDVRTVIPGHGEPFGDVGRALERAYSRLEAFAADPVRNARHILKGLLVFSLLGRQRMRVAELPAYCESIAMFGEINRIFLGIPTAALADMLVAQLIDGRIVRRDGDAIVPA